MRQRRILFACVCVAACRADGAGSETVVDGTTAASSTTASGGSTEASGLPGTDATGSASTNASSDTTGIVDTGTDEGGEPPIDCAAVMCRFVRAGAEGDGGGSDWTNAFATLPDDLERGAFYFVADGDYDAYVFDDEESGVEVISVRKATVEDHGTEVGWDPDYGDGTASFGSLSFARDHYAVSGVRRDETAWDAPDSYGFRVPGGIASWPLNFPPGGDDISVAYVDIGAEASEEFVPDTPTGVYWVKNDGTPGLLTGLTLRSSHVHNVTVHVMLLGVEDFLIEDCYFGPGWGKEAIRGQDVVRDGTIAHNVFRDSSQETPGEAGSGSTAPIAIWGSDDAEAYRDLHVHGNVFWDTKQIPHSGGVVVLGGDGTSWVGAPANGCQVHNNTIAGLRDFRSSIWINGGADNRVYNNLWFDWGDAQVGPTGSGFDEGNNLLVDADPFVDYGGGDLRLAAGADAIDAGADLGPPYDVDLSGNMRGADGTWDVGAFEAVD